MNFDTFQRKAALLILLLISNGGLNKDTSAQTGFVSGAGKEVRRIFVRNVRSVRKKSCPSGKVSNHMSLEGLPDRQSLQPRVFNVSSA
jgi:hypothetical protein